MLIVEIIDAQIHDPRPVRPLGAAYGDDVHLLLGCELAREAMDSVGVDVALMNSRQEICDYAVGRYPDRFAGCGLFDSQTEDIDGWAAGYRQRPGMLAVRVLVVDWTTGAPTDDFRAGRLEPVFAAAERHRLPVFAMAMGLADQLIPVARAHPELALILDHLGVTSPPSMNTNPDPWTELPAVLAHTPYPYPDLWPHLHKLLDAFGPGRLMWGSDFTRLRCVPGTNQRGPRGDWAGLYSDCVSFLRDTTEISPADKALMFAGTIRRLLRWPPAPPADLRRESGGRTKLSFRPVSRNSIQGRCERLAWMAKYGELARKDFHA
jgi:predicted TIM-barrel fold metal-dependent hydrolase